MKVNWMKNPKMKIALTMTYLYLKKTYKNMKIKKLNMILHFAITTVGVLFIYYN